MSFHDLVEDSYVFEVGGIAPGLQGPVGVVELEDIEGGIGELEAAGGEEVEAEAVAEEHADDAAVADGENAFAGVVADDLAEGLGAAGEGVGPGFTAAEGSKMGVAASVESGFFGEALLNLFESEAFEVAEGALADIGFEADLVLLAQGFDE